MRKVAILAISIAAAAVAITMASVAWADNDGGGNNFRAELDGWAETPSVVTTGHGSFRLRVVSAEQWEFVLRWEDLEGGAAAAAHIHVGSHHESGGVSAHLCGGTQPPCEPGSDGEVGPDGEVRGVILPKDVVGPFGQGVEPGNMADLLRAIRAGEAYPNVHNMRFGGGEIRGQIRDRHNHGGGGDSDD